jgi:DNA-binding NtrC family response regulator
MDASVEVIMITAVNEIKTAVEAIKMGAYEYLVKPFEMSDVLTVIDRALEKKGLMNEVAYLKDELKRYHLFEKMVGKDGKMVKVFDLITTFAQGDGTVLIQGESGTGKELVARAIHNRSERKAMPFVVLNCAAIPSMLMESEIFGYNQGAFTGASRTTLGKLEIANKGTVFLDDIDCLEINMQAKLLRVIQEKEFERLGSNKVIKIDVRFLAASNKKLKKLIEQGKFREDLYYRLNVFPLELPPLRERKGDIPLLLGHYLKFFSEKNGTDAKAFSKKAIKALVRYEWPGNVRELQNLIERLCTVVKNPVIRLEDIRPYNNGKSTFDIEGLPLKDAMQTFEKRYIGNVLDSVYGSRTKAAEILGIHRNTLLRKLS